MKIYALVFCIFAFGINAFGQTSWADNLVGNWKSTTYEGIGTRKIKIIKVENALLITETTSQKNDSSGKLEDFVTESKFYLDGRLQKDGLKKPSIEAKTEVGKQKLTTVFFVDNYGKPKKSHKETWEYKNGQLVITAFVKFGVPFLSATTREILVKE